MKKYENKYLNLARPQQAMGADGIVEALLDINFFLKKIRQERVIEK
jgi:hypothetical protein